MKRDALWLRRERNTLAAPRPFGQREGR
jgi:hypothetical protein